MVLVIVMIVGKYEYVIHVDDAIRQVAKYLVHHSLECGTTVTGAERGVVEEIASEWRSYGGLWDVVWMRLDLKVAFQQILSRRCAPCRC